MKRRLLFAVVTVFSLALPVAAYADFVDDMVIVLTQQGYSDIEVMRTLLGRTRILASRDNGTRELVVNPRTGEVLRDVWTTRQGERVPQVLSGSNQDDDGDEGSNSGHGGGGGDRDDDDDRDDSDDDGSDDNSHGNDDDDDDD